MIDVHLVVDPWTRESRGFGFVTMETLEEAERCVKYLNRSVLEGRVITVEKVYISSSALFCGAWIFISYFFFQPQCMEIMWVICSLVPLSFESFVLVSI